MTYSQITSTGCSGQVPVIEVVIPGIQSTGAGGGAYVHTQSAPASTWTINHNLGYRPSVELLDAGGQEIDGAISHPTVNQVVATFNPATAGSARLV